MTWEERFQKLAKEKRDEFDKRLVEEAQECERKNKNVERFGPIVDDIVRVIRSANLEIVVSKFKDTHPAYDEWGLSFSKGGGKHSVAIGFYPDRIYVVHRNGLISSTDHSVCIELSENLEEETLFGRFREAIAECIEAIRFIEEDRER